jgi:trehalose-6-phosphate hydrolase
MFIERCGAGAKPDELLAILASKSRDNSRTPMPVARRRERRLQRR